MKQVMAFSTEEEFFEYLEEQHGDDQLYKALNEFHGWLRDETEIAKGVGLQYVKRLLKDLNSDGSIPEDVEYSSALRKYREFQEQRGESQS